MLCTSPSTFGRTRALTAWRWKRISPLKTVTSSTPTPTDVGGAVPSICLKGAISCDLESGRANELWQWSVQGGGDDDFKNVDAAEIGVAAPKGPKIDSRQSSKAAAIALSRALTFVGLCAEPDVLARKRFARKTRASSQGRRVRSPLLVSKCWARSQRQFGRRRGLSGSQ